jgi:hypothetical protein
MDTIAQVETEIRRRLGGQVTDLHVVLRSNGLALQGRSRTYYAKQLAQQVALEVTELSILANEIQVCERVLLGRGR